MDSIITKRGQFLPAKQGTRTTDGTKLRRIVKEGDVKIYNYALAPLDVALMYVGFVPEAEPCVGTPEFDVNRDCIVDLLDVKAMVVDDDNWLDCNIVPTCVPKQLPL